MDAIDVLRQSIDEINGTIERLQHIEANQNALNNVY